MKKVLEAELLSIAHRVLQMKEKEVDNLYKEAKELYEKLLILKFYQDYTALGQITDITEDELQEKLQAVYSEDAKETVLERQQMPENLAEKNYPLVVEQEAKSVENKPINQMLETAVKVDPETTAATETTKPVDYDSDFTETPFEEEEDENDALLHQYLDEHEALLNDNQETGQAPVQNTKEDIKAEADNTENQPDSQPDEEPATNQPVLESKEDNPFFGFDFGDVEFIRVEDVEEVEAQKFDAEFTAVENEETIASKIETQVQDITEKNTVSAQSQNTLFNMEQMQAKPEKTKSLNDIYSGTLVVGLNDRIAFEKYLFDGSAEDLNRVLSQLNTVSSLDEAKSFIDHLVKPEYNNWEGKEEYEERFLGLIEKKFI